MNRYQQELKERTKDHLLRTLPSPSTGVDFHSNDYLGLSIAPDLLQEVQQEYESLPSKRTGSTGSRLLSGNTVYAESLENSIADFHNVQSALLFSSGYSANVGLLSALGKRNVTYIPDAFIHASMIDGICLSHARSRRFRHNDVEDLRRQLTKTEGEKIVLVESVYSMDGDIAPLNAIIDVCNENGAKLIVDEAHAVGVIGESGEGYCSMLGIQNDVLSTIVTFGKAMGTHGAAVLGEKWLTDYLMNFARSFIYSTAPSDHQLTSIKCAYHLTSKSQHLRTQLNNNINYFRFRQAGASALKWLTSATAIQSLIIPGNERVINTANYLSNEGITILPVRSPSVPQGQERLRISLHAYNTRNEIDHFFEAISKWRHEE